MKQKEQKGRDEVYNTLQVKIRDRIHDMVSVVVLSQVWDPGLGGVRSEMRGVGVRWWVR